MTRDSVVQRSSLPLSAAVDGEVVMFHPDRGAYFSLGAVGSRIWELAEQPTSLGALCGTLEHEYDIEPERCQSEVVGFVTALHEAGLVDIDA